MACIDAQNSGTDAKNSGTDAENLGIDAGNLGIDAELHGIHAQTLGIDAQNFGIDPRNFRIDAENLGIDGGNLRIEPEPSTGVSRPIAQMSGNRQKLARAPEGAPGTCRNRRRPNGDRRRWVRPFYRANNALYSSFRLIASTLRTVAAAERTVHRRPIRASKKLDSASELLVTASTRLLRAVQNLAEMTERAAREPETAQDVPEFVVTATARWMYMTSWLAETSDEVLALQRSILHGLETGELIPERPSDRRPRIALAPRPVPIRAFLKLRQPRVHDRIGPLLLRRRRTPRPVALRVPRRNVLGRAPPLVSVCLH